MLRSLAQARRWAVSLRQCRPRQASWQCGAPAAPAHVARCQSAYTADQPESSVSHDVVDALPQQLSWPGRCRNLLQLTRLANIFLAPATCTVRGEVSFA